MEATTFAYWWFTHADDLVNYKIRYTLICIIPVNLREVTTETLGTKTLTYGSHIQTTGCLKSIILR